MRSSYGRERTLCFLRTSEFRNRQLADLSDGIWNSYAELEPFVDLAGLYFFEIIAIWVPGAVERQGTEHNCAEQIV